MRFQVRFAVLVPFKCGLDRGLRFLNVLRARFCLNFCDGLRFQVENSHFGRKFEILF